MTQPGLYPPRPGNPPPHPKRPVWPWLTVGGAALFVAGVFVFAFWMTSGDDSTGGSRAGLVSSEPPLRQALTTCESGELADGDHTMTIDSEGEEYGSGTATVTDVACILTELGTPQSVVARMDATRALDGMQNAEWDGFEASWTYHPDQGLDLIITENE